ncbi:hypothetical protein [Pandoraea sp. NPDC087047]|uniref:hypothetical protein n=1 Tax=Pandoraea sp. NPDC087047 TaxID=3364390 RepID=UPI00382D5983
MKSSILRRHGTGPLGATLGLVLAILCVLAPCAVRAEPEHRGNQVERQNVKHDVRRDTYRREGPRHYDGYRGGGGDYVYGAPPVVYAPPASPGISLFLPLEFR